MNGYYVMSHQTLLSSDDFQEQPRADAGGRVWLSRTVVPSPLGPFSVESFVAPDDELVAAANAAIDLLAKEHQTILNTLYGLYQRAAEDRRWMQAHRVPRDLSCSEVADYTSDHFVSVRRSPDGRVKPSISIRMRWDSEHIVLFGVRSGRLILESP
jgi:hypothetical protein